MPKFASTKDVKFGISHALNQTIMEKTTCNYGLEAKQPKKSYKAEGDEIIKNLRSKESGAKYCYQFFFDTMVTDDKGKTKKKSCQISPLRSKMIYEFQRDFGVTLKPEDISSVVYQAVWAEGSFSPLDTYKGKSPFFSWLKKVARNAVMEWLVDEHLIHDVPSCTVGNTRLALLSQPPSKCKMVIDDMMAGSKYHALLTAIYADRLPTDEIIKRFHFKDMADFEAAKAAGEYKLKDALFRSVEYSEENILRDRKKHVVMVSSEFVADLADWVKSKTDVNPLSDVFGTDLTDEEVRTKTVEFLYDFSAQLWPEKVGNDDDVRVNENDNEETKQKKAALQEKNEEKGRKNQRDRYIWCQRFLEKSDPVELARELGCDRAWLDTRYSRMNAKFNKAIKQWWKSHAS